MGKALRTKRFVILLLTIFGVIYFLLHQSIQAAPVYDQDNGTWTDGYADNTGLSYKTQVDVDTSDGKLKLTNSSGGFTPPFYTSGYARTTSIIPTSVAQWGSITFTAETPENTSITIQVLDESNNVYSETYLPGNGSGFTSSPIDISSLQVDRTAGSGAKFGRLRLKISLATTDTDVTPAIDTITLSWTVRQGDTSASALASTAWPIRGTDKRGTRNSSYYMNPGYPAVRWVYDQGTSFYAQITRGSGETIFSRTRGVDSKLSALNRNTGATILEKISYSGYNDRIEEGHTLSENGTLYVACEWNDILLAYDTTDGSLKWTYQFGSTHGNDYVTIADDGTLYTTRADGNFTIYAFNPDGSVKWTKSVDPPNSPSVSPITLGSDGTVYFGTKTYNPSNGIPTGGGKLYALDPSDGSIDWEYPTGDIAGIWATPIVDSDGTIYVAHTDGINSFEKKIFAINSDGTLKWERNVGTTVDAWYALALRSDGILLAIRDVNYQSNSYIEAINTSDGSLAWSRNNNDFLRYEMGSLFSDGLNGFYYADRTSGANLYYFDSSANQKWEVIVSGAAFYYYSFDESGRLYGALNVSGETTIFALFPWTLSVSTSPANPYHAGDEITFTVTTAMQETNLLTGDSNQIQIVVDNNDKVALSYSSTNDDNDTIWTGNYTIPSNIGDGEHGYTVEANAAGIETDISLNFDSPATDSNNTGYTVTGTFTVDDTAPSSFDLISPGHEEYVSDPRPTFKWRAASTPDVTAGISHYKFEVRYEDGGGFIINNIPALGPSDFETDKYAISYENLWDSDSSNNYLSLQTKSSPEWGECEGKLKEGTNTWSVRAIDHAGNEREQARIVYFGVYPSLTPTPTLTPCLLTKEELETKIIEKERISAETEEEKQRIKEEGYIVQIKVVDENGSPVKGAKVSLYSEPKVAYTDENGIATFKSIDPGEHRALIAYGGKQGEQEINLSGDYQEFKYTIQVKPTNPFLSLPVILVIGFLSLSLLSIILYFLYRQRGLTPSKK